MGHSEGRPLNFGLHLKCQLYCFLNTKSKLNEETYYKKRN